MAESEVEVRKNPVFGAYIEHRFKGLDLATVDGYFLRYLAGEGLAEEELKFPREGKIDTALQNLALQNLIDILREAGDVKFFEHQEEAMNSERGTLTRYSPLSNGERLSILNETLKH